MDTHANSGTLSRSAYTFKPRNNIDSFQKKTFTKSLGGPWPPCPPPWLRHCVGSEGTRGHPLGVFTPTSVHTVAKVSCRNQLSGKCQLQIGVPQGSVLGPLLFLIYVNDINRHVHLGSCNIYADDTLIYCTGNNITELKCNIQKCVTDVHEWYESNKLVINTSKSNVMLLTTRQMLSNMSDTALNVFIGNHKLPQCNSIKYLGVDIDNVLSWNLQTDSISKKLVFIISRLSRLKSVLPSQMLMYIYTSIVQPKIDYAISIWGYTTAHNINKVQRLQNRAARILTGNFDYVNTRGIDLVNNLGLMNVIQRRDYFMLIMMFKSIHGLVPDYICDQITMQRDITVRTTRSTVNNNVHVPHILLECCKNAFAYRGPVLWNALPENIKKCETLNCFKKCVKLHVVE